MKLGSDSGNLASLSNRHNEREACKKRFPYKTPRQATPYPSTPCKSTHHSQDGSLNRRPNSRIPVAQHRTESNLTNIGHPVRPKRVKASRRHWNQHFLPSCNRDSQVNLLSKTNPSRSTSGDSASSKQYVPVLRKSSQKATDKVVFCSRGPYSPPGSPPVVQIYKRHHRALKKQCGRKEAHGLCSTSNNGPVYSQASQCSFQPPNECQSTEDLLGDPSSRRQLSHTSAKISLGLVPSTEGCLQGPHATRNKHIHFYDQRHSQDHPPCRTPLQCEFDRGDGCPKVHELSPRAQGLPPLPTVKNSKYRTTRLAANKPRANKVHENEDYVPNILSNPLVAVGTNRCGASNYKLGARNRSRVFIRSATPIPSPSESCYSLKLPPLLKRHHTAVSTSNQFCRNSTIGTPQSGFGVNAADHPHGVNSDVCLPRIYQNLSQSSSTNDIRQSLNESSHQVICPLCAKLKGSCALHQRSMMSRYLTDLEWRICNAVNIYVYKNGEEGQTPVLIHIPPAKKKDMKTVMAVIQERISYPIGYAKYLYKMNGKKITNPADLEMYCNYVVASSYDKCFKAVCYNRKKSPLLVLNKESKHVRELRVKNLQYECRMDKPEMYDQDQQNVYLDVNGNGSDSLAYKKCLLEEKEAQLPPPGPLLFVNGTNAEKNVYAKQNSGNNSDFSAQPGRNNLDNYQQPSLNQIAELKQREFTVAPGLVSSTVAGKKHDKSVNCAESEDIMAARSIGPGRCKGGSTEAASTVCGNVGKKCKGGNASNGNDSNGDRKVCFQLTQNTNHITNDVHERPPPFPRDYLAKREAPNGQGYDENNNQEPKVAHYESQGLTGEASDCTSVESGKWLQAGRYQHAPNRKEDVQPSNKMTQSTKASHKVMTSSKTGSQSFYPAGNPALMHHARDTPVPCNYMCNETDYPSHHSKAWLRSEASEADPRPAQVSVSKSYTVLPTIANGVHVGPRDDNQSHFSMQPAHGGNCNMDSKRVLRDSTNGNILATELYHMKNQSVDCTMRKSPQLSAAEQNCGFDVSNLPGVPQQQPSFHILASPEAITEAYYSGSSVKHPEHGPCPGPQGAHKTKMGVTMGGPSSHVSSPTASTYYQSGGPNQNLHECSRRNVAIQMGQPTFFMPAYSNFQPVVLHQRPTCVNYPSALPYATCSYSGYQGVGGMSSYGAGLHQMPATMGQGQQNVQFFSGYPSIFSPHKLAYCNQFYQQACLPSEPEPFLSENSPPFLPPPTGYRDSGPNPPIVPRNSQVGRDLASYLSPRRGNGKRGSSRASRS